MELENKFKRKRSSSSEELKDINKRALSNSIDELPMSLLRQRPSSVPLGARPSKTSHDDDSDNIHDQNNALFRKLYLKNSPDCVKSDEESLPAALDQVDNDSNANDLAESDATKTTEVDSGGSDSDDSDSDGSDSEKSEDDEAGRMEYLQSFIRCIDELQETLNEGYSDAESDSNENPFEALLEHNAEPVTPRIDPHTLGFLVCAQSAMKFLHDEGLKPNDPFLVSLKHRLIQGLGRIGQD